MCMLVSLFRWFLQITARLVDPYFVFSSSSNKMNRHTPVASGQRNDNRLAEALQRFTHAVFERPQVVLSPSGNDGHPEASPKRHSQNEPFATIDPASG